MNFLTNFLLFISLFLAISSAVPQISCTFSAHVRLNALWNDVPFSYNYTHYSIENFAYADYGTVPLSYPGNSTLIFKPPNHYTMIQPFFDRSTCVTIPINSALKCYQLDFDASIRESKKPCPGNKALLCDKWWFIDTSDADNTYYIISDSNPPILHRVVIDGENDYEVIDFDDWKNEKPDPSLFEIPSNQPCANLVDSSLDDKFGIFELNRIFGPKDKTTTLLKRSNNLVNSQEEVELSAKNAKTWTAKASSFFSGLTYAQVSKMLHSPIENFGKSHISKSKPHQVNTFHGAIPAEFDARTAWPKCGITEIRNQGSCGSCWAFGAAESFSDRFCIHTNSSSPVVLSPQYIVSCDKKNDGCDGGYLDLAWENLEKGSGTVTEDCFPYQGATLKCPKACKDGSTPVVFKASPIYSVYVPFNAAKNVEAIQYEILTNGPVEAALWVMTDFMHYSSGVYKRTAGSSLVGGHAIKIIGWGFDSASNLPYWTVANSWGTSWGINGTFKIVRGTNECALEDEIATGIPLPI